MQMREKMKLLFLGGLGFNIIFPRFMNLLVNLIFSLQVNTIRIILYRHHIFITDSSVHGHGGCFCFLAIVNSVAKKHG